MSASFGSNSSTGEDPACCEIRQDISWTGPTPSHPGFSPPSNYSSSTWYEDRDPHDERYGYRSDPNPQSFNQYLNPSGRRNQTGGTVYYGEDDPYVSSGKFGQIWKFRLRVVDVCNGGKRVGSSSSVTVNW